MQIYLETSWSIILDDISAHYQCYHKLVGVEKTSVRPTENSLLAAGGSGLETLFMYTDSDYPQRGWGDSVMAQTLNYFLKKCSFVTNKTKTEIEANLQGLCYYNTFKEVQDFMLDKKFHIAIFQLVLK